MNRYLLPGIAVLAGAMLCAPNAIAQEGKHSEHHPAGAEAKAQTPAKEKCQMMADHAAKMKRQMKTMQTKLDGLLEEMNAATGESKTEAMAAVVNEMAAQQSKMRDMRQKMMSRMMSHMSEHMMVGATEEGRAGMMQCPMMQGKKGDKQGTSDPSEPDSGSASEEGSDRK